MFLHVPGAQVRRAVCPDQAGDAGLPGQAVWPGHSWWPQEQTPLLCHRGQCFYCVFLSAFDGWFSFNPPLCFQLSFRSVQSTVETKRDQVRRILQLPPSSSSSDTETSAAREMETAVTAYLRRATDTFDLSKNVEVRKQNLLKCVSRKRENWEFKAYKS